MNHDNSPIIEQLNFLLMKIWFEIFRIVRADVIQKKSILINDIEITRHKSQQFNAEILILTL